MTLAICADLSPADWIVKRGVPWRRLVTFGPAGFGAYARVRFIPDPTHPGQQEWEADPGTSPTETEQWRTLLQLLATETSAPSDCYFGLWEGWPLPDPPRRWPRFSVPSGAAIPARSFFLFHGALSEVELSDRPADTGIWGPEFSDGGTPAFVWPADHAWCIAADVDPHWAGVGSSMATIERLLASSRLDAVLADPRSEQPAYDAFPADEVAQEP